MESIELSQKNATDFICSLCHYNTSNSYDYKKHLQTKKHKINEKSMFSNTEKKYECKNCFKTYKDNSGLWRHKRTCKPVEEDKKQDIAVIEEKKEEISVTDAKFMFDMFKEFMLEQSKSMAEQNSQIINLVEKCITNNNNISNINNGNINNNNYNQFNLQLYLNETCKNAMTIDEFLDYLQPTLEELEATARLGYVEGITRIIMRGLKDLEEELRPFHCSDLKRESLFVKNPDGEWEKETDEKPLMLKFVKAVARKNFNNVNEWRKLHPNCRYHDSKSNDMFNQIMLNSTSGRTEEEQKASYEKIIKNITKEVVIDKSKKNKAK